jgi:hypothetical protein
MNNRMEIEISITLILLSAAAYFSTGSIVAALVVLLVGSLGAYFLGVWLGVSLDSPIHFVFDTELAPEPSGLSFNWSLPLPVGIPEVFYVAGDKYTYKEASDVCAVYDAQLATYDQLLDAYARGAEWCGYGWSQGGMALYPTQDQTWQFLQQDDDTRKRKSCGRPGVNGGYFDLNTRFGVNCYGVKPDCNNRKYPIPIGQEEQDKAKIDELKKNSAKIKVWPFNRNGWNQWGF